MEVNISGVPLSTVTSLNQGPTPTVASISTDRGKDATPRHGNLVFSRSHVVEDEHSLDSGSMRYSPPSPSTHGGFRNFVTDLDSTATATSSSSRREFSLNGISSNQTLHKGGHELGKGDGTRGISYPSPIGRGSSSNHVSGSMHSRSSSKLDSSSTSLDPSNPFSQNLPFQGEKVSSDNFSSSNNTFIENRDKNSKDSIDIFNKDLANLSLGNTSGSPDYSQSYSPGNRGLIQNRNQSSPGTIGSSFHTEEKSSGQQNSRR